MCVIQMATLFVLDALRAYLPVGSKVPIGKY